MTFALRFIVCTALVFAVVHRFDADIASAAIKSASGGLFAAALWTASASSNPLLKALWSGVVWSTMAVVSVGIVLMHFHNAPQTSDYMQTSFPTAIVMIAVFVVSFGVGVVRKVRTHQKADDQT